MHHTFLRSLPRTKSHISACVCGMDCGPFALLRTVRIETANNLHQSAMRIRIVRIQIFYTYLY